MGNDLYLLRDVSLQDRDLLTRLNLYFDSIDSRLKEGQGWLIFNAQRQRAARVTNLILSRLAELRPLVSYYLAPWRDFSLNAYMYEVELAGRSGHAATGTEDDRLQQEYRLAHRVSQDTYYLMLSCDLLVVSGFNPSHGHELRYLDRITEGRHRQRLATVLVTPRLPHELKEDFHTIDPSDTYWDRIFKRFYETSLIAL